MPRSIIRVLLSMALLCMVPVVFVLVYFAALEIRWIRSDTFVMLGTALVSFGLFGVGWLLVWGSGVTWTRGRRVHTRLSIGAALLPALAVYALFRLMDSYEEVGIMMGGLAWASAWIAWTAWIWRETPMEQAARLRGEGTGKLPCPQCGYDLTGLQQARCPECGTQFTLDELFASLRSGDAGLEADQ